MMVDDYSYVFMIFKSQSQSRSHNRTMTKVLTIVGAVIVGQSSTEYSIGEETLAMTQRTLLHCASP